MLQTDSFPLFILPLSHKAPLPIFWTFYNEEEAKARRDGKQFVYLLFLLAGNLGIPHPPLGKRKVSAYLKMDRWIEELCTHSSFPFFVRVTRVRVLSQYKVGGREGNEPEKVTLPSQ